MENIARIYSVTNGGSQKNNEAFSRTILDQILICSLYEEGHTSDQQPKQAKDEGPSNISHAHPSTSDTNTQEEDPAKLELLHEMPLSRFVTHQGETKLLTGFADYSVWYDSAKKKTLATNLLIVEAKRWGTTDLALPQLAAYMGIVHSTRKEESKENYVVYGAASDGGVFRFCRIDNDGVFTHSRLLEWEEDKLSVICITRIKPVLVRSTVEGGLGVANFIDNFFKRAPLPDICGCASSPDCTPKYRYYRRGEPILKRSRLIE